jgi:hypothetical protein
MKRTLVKFAILVALATAAGRPAAFAQSGPIRATIPFGFNIGGTWLEAGTYVVKLENGQVCRLIDDEGRTKALTITNAVIDKKKQNGQARLIFNRYGDRHFLSSIFWEGYTQGRELLMSPAEIETAKRVTPSERVAVQLR